MTGRRTRSVSWTITLASIGVALSIALLVGWTLVLAQNLSLSGQATQSTWLLIAGPISFIIIMGVLIAFAVFLVGQIREVRLQYSFMDSVTHELKSPLASIKLLLETLEREGLADAQRIEIRRMMRTDVNRLSTFIDDVLEASRVAHGQRSSQLSEVSLFELSERCREQIAQRYQLNPENLSVEHKTEDTLIYTDSTALEIVLKNLLDNAVKYSRDEVAVVLRTDIEAKKRAIFEVQDQGIGIGQKDLKRIFQRFYRVPETQVRERRGTGIGLYVVSGLVAHLGGKLAVHSEGANTGTIIRITLPLRTPPASQQPA